MENICNLTACEIRERILKRELTSEEVVRAIFDRIEKTDDEIGSFVSLRKEKALEEAREVDRKIRDNESVGELAGIPVALKDNIVSYGEPSQSASRILEGYRGVYDATIVKKLKAADAIIIGKTNMDELAMGSTTKTSCYGETKNPCDLERVPGGSSGGAATSVAANQCYISIGSDTGGSIRQPASFCGVVGLKPTYGRVSRYGLMAFSSSLDQLGPLGKTVKDVALALKVIAGSDEYDATTENVEVIDYMKELTKNIKGMRIGVPKECYVEGLNPEIKKMLEESIKIFEELGAEIVEISLLHTKYAAAVYYIIAPAEASSNLARFDGVRYGYRSEKCDNIDELYINSRSEGFGSEVKRRIMIGTYVLSSGYYDAYFKKAQKVRRLIKEDFEQAFKNVDIILTPTTPAPAFKLSDKKTPLELYLEDLFTIPANLAGIPGLAIPVKKINNLPIGIQLLGKPFKEEEILRAGDAFENRIKERD